MLGRASNNNCSCDILTGSWPVYCRAWHWLRRRVWLGEWIFCQEDCLQYTIALLYVAQLSFKFCLCLGLTSLLVLRAILDTHSFVTGELYDLEQLYLSDNALTALPDDLALCTNLEILSASHNQLSALPVEMVNISKWVPHTFKLCSLACMKYFSVEIVLY